MLCKIPECGRDAKYKSQQVCQKHYFRFMRTGSYQKKRGYRTQNSKGYQMLWEPDHPLAMKNGYVYEHRLVMWSLLGDDVGSCQMCDKPIDWSSLHIDHIDEDVTNNSKGNLRALCRPCNTRRGRKPEHCYKGKTAVYFDGETKTPTEWARDPRCSVTGRTIKSRIHMGYTPEQAILLPSKTNRKISDHKSVDRVK